MKEREEIYVNTFEAPLCLIILKRMINTHTKVFSLAALLSLGALTLSTTSSAYALVNVNTGGSASTSAQTSGSVNNTSTQGSGSADVNTTIDLNGNTNGDSSSASNDTSSTGSIDLSSDMIGEGGRLDVTHDDVVSGSAEADFSGEEAVSSAQVSTNADLKAYARSAIRADEQVEGIHFTGKAVEVKYKEKGRFLALLPITFTVSAITHADGRVEVKYPWYSFLTVDNHDKVETELKVAIDNALRSRMVGSVQAEGSAANASFTAAESAAVAAQMQKVLNANLSESGSAQVSTEAED